MGLLSHNSTINKIGYTMNFSFIYKKKLFEKIRCWSLPNKSDLYTFNDNIVLSIVLLNASTNSIHVKTTFIVNCLFT